MKIAVFLLKSLISLIVGQTLFFKFSEAAESVYIFSILGVEPWGRLVLGVLELLSVVLLWIPQTALYSLLLLLGVMSGAIAGHLLILGIEIREDGGELFILALITWLAVVILLYTRRKEIRSLLMKFRRGRRAL